MNQLEEKETVLVVDDAPANIQVVNSILKDICKVRIATDGAKALALVKTDPLPDLILLDVVMPGMDGYEVCTRLKADPATAGIPVIFLTVQTESEDETHGFDVGAVDYIHKPFSPAVVKARVHTHLVLRGIREQLARQLDELRKELETARQIQLSILPAQVPQMKGLDIAARYIAANSVAGDFYDFIVIDEQHLGILVADVSGHGMPAALISSMLKIALSTQVANATDPAKVLFGLNQALCGKFDQHFVTAAYLLVDLEKRTLTYSGAGHPPMWLWGPAIEGTREVAENGLFLGRFPWATYSSVELPLNRDTWILLYTDGVSEMANPAEEEFGTTHFKEFLPSSRSDSATQFADRLLAELSSWAARGPGFESNDDVTFVALHVGA
jgi:sigma-B regulation protein RsbU (phosphoserine phosphatase)